MSSNTESHSLLWHVLDQWKLWAVALLAVPVAAAAWNDSGASFHTTWLVLFSLTIALLALRNTGPGLRLQKRAGW